MLEAMTKFAATLKVGGADANLGPIQNEMQYERVKGFFDDVKKNGYKIAHGGNAEYKEGKGFFVEPTIVDNPPNGSRIIEEEPFGTFSQLCVTLVYVTNTIQVLSSQLNPGPTRRKSSAVPTAPTLVSVHASGARMSHTPSVSLSDSRPALSSSTALRSPHLKPSSVDTRRVVSAVNGDRWVSWPTATPTPSTSTSKLGSVKRKRRDTEKAGLLRHSVSDSIYRRAGRIYHDRHEIYIPTYLTHPRPHTYNVHSL